MQEYKVVLTQKVVVELEAESASQALEFAKLQATADGRKFEPASFSVKEK